MVDHRFPRTSFAPNGERLDLPCRFRRSQPMRLLHLHHAWAGTTRLLGGSMEGHAAWVRPRPDMPEPESARKEPVTRKPVSSPERRAS